MAREKGGASKHSHYKLDAVTDVTMGQIVDRSKPTKDGKFRPWIKRMCGPGDRRRDAAVCL